MIVTHNFKFHHELLDQVNSFEHPITGYTSSKISLKMNPSDLQAIEKLKKLKVVHLKELANAVGISPYGMLFDFFPLYGLLIFISFTYCVQGERLLCRPIYSRLLG